MEDTQKKDTQKKENDSRWYYDLLKYPILTLCIVLGMICLAKFAGIEFDKITKISTSGIEFANEQAANAVVDLNDSINKVNMKLSNLEAQFGIDLNMKPKVNQISAVGGVKIDANETAAKEAANTLKSTEIVTNAVAAMSYKDSEKNTHLKGKSGYIWIGAYYNQWLAGNFGIPQVVPEEIPIEQYTLTQNLKLREVLPSANDSTDSNNFIGVVPRHTPISLLAVKKGADNQYWAYVKVMK